MERKPKEEFSKSIGYLFISQIFIKILGLTYSLYLINKPKFGDEGNAIYLSGYQIFALVLTFSSIGVPNAVSNLIAKSSNTDTLNKVFSTAIGIYLSIACICSILLYVFANKIAQNFIGIDCVSYNLKLLAPIVIFTTIESIYIGFFNGIKQMKITAKVQFVEQLFKTMFTIFIVELLSRKTNNVEILSIGATLATCLSILISFFICFIEKKKTQIFLKNFEKNKITTREIVKKLLKFSIPVSIGAMLVSINKNSDSYFIMNVLSDRIGIESAKKIYGIIASKIDVLVLFPLAFNINFSTALIPNISEAKKNNNYKIIKQLSQKSVFMSLAIGIICSFGLYFFAEDIFNLLFSNSKDGIELLKLSSFTIVFSVLNQTFAGILQGLQKNRIPVISSVIGTVFKVLLNYIFLKKTNFLGKGIIFSNIISNLIMFIILYYNLKKEMDLDVKKYIIQILISGIIMVVVMNFLNNIFIKFRLDGKIIFIFSGILGVMVYLAGILRISDDLSFLEKQKNFLRT